MNCYKAIKQLKQCTLLLAMLTFVFTTFAQEVNNLKLKDFHPVSIYKVPQTKVEKAKYPVIDFHSHDYPKSDAEVDDWVHTMDEVGIAKTIILSYSTGAGFDSLLINMRAIKIALKFGVVLIIVIWIKKIGAKGQ